MARILIIDDNKLFCDMLQEVAHAMEHDVTSAHLLAEGLRAARSGDFDVVFLQAKMPGGKGIRVLPKILATRSSPEVIVISDAGIPDEAEEAIKKGAWDYIDRPSQGTIALAHRLRPRYLTYVGGNFPALRTVIDKMREGYAQA